MNTKSLGFVFVLTFCMFFHELHSCDSEYRELRRQKYGSRLERGKHAIHNIIEDVKHWVSPSSSTYDPSEGLRNLYFAYGAYCDSTQLLDWTCKWCDYISDFNITTVYEKDDLQVFVGIDNEGEQIVVSFRGTCDVEDWLDDLDYFKTDYPWVSGGKVHRGFYESWGELSSKVMDATTMLMDAHNTMTLLVTGHSLGAAMAQLAAANFSRYKEENSLSNSIITYTYGSPRWGNDEVAEYYATMIDLNWRMVNVKDIVPTVPPEDFGFHHTWTEVHYTSDSPLEYTVCDGSGEDDSCSYDIPSIKDHLWYFDLYEDCSS